MRWGQGNDRSRSGSVRQAFFWLDNPWWGQKLAERKDAVPVRACGRGLQRPRRQTTLICANRKLCRSGAGRIGLSGRLLEPFAF